jgi:hypothetical protein
MDCQLGPCLHETGEVGWKEFIDCKHDMTTHETNESDMQNLRFNLLAAGERHRAAMVHGMEGRAKISDMRKICYDLVDWLVDESFCFNRTNHL